MQSAVPHVLAALDRTHDPSASRYVVGWARDAGLDVSLDLIYGTPGESIDDWRRSLERAIAEQPDHLSAYALIVEEGTKLARQIRRGELASPRTTSRPTCTNSPTSCSAAGFDWYEVSNWATESRIARGTTSATGGATTGGASAPARTATSAACAGGTPSIRPPMPSA